ncbi:codanin-1, partial [Gadus morhua]|uniref:codanin-1 n=1 Tax=Gadus morhua TaxID=8049 RepID=UPI0011B41534
VLSGSLPSRVTKPSRRINPTPVSAERPHSKPKSCFTSTPFSRPPSPPPPGAEALGGALVAGGALSLQEERVLLREEKNKRAQVVSSPLKLSVDSATPTKSVMPRMGSKVTPDALVVCPDPSKVTMMAELDLLAEVYCTCISENLVPNIFLELFFMVQLLTSRSAATTEEEEQSVCVVKPDMLESGFLRQVHNCVYFAVRVLENQFQLVTHLDRVTLRLLAENERVTCFSPSLRERLSKAQGTSPATLSPSASTFIYSVPFQPATDNRSNFSSDRAFHVFKKQRDIFYEVLREWEDFHKEPGWNFEAALGGRVRAMVSQLNSAGNHSHFARLFLKQLVQMCKGPRSNAPPVDPPDADLLGLLGADSLGRLKRLEERLSQPHCIVGPCPPPSFPGHQEFFRDVLQTASCCQLNQHLKDRLCQQLLQLDEVSILGPGAASVGEGEEEGGGGERDLEQQDEKQRFSSVLLLARLLAKFLGFLSFLPYQSPERPPRELQEAALALRSKSAPVLDVCGLLRRCVGRGRAVLTLPWMVEFLSMMDFTGPLLPCYRSALGSLLLLYRGLVLGRGGGVCYLNKLLMVAALGWLFQIPVIPEDIFFTSDFTDVARLEDPPTGVQGLDCLPLVDQQLLYVCCPFLGEFRKILAAFVSGSAAKSSGILRKITPTSAEPRDAPIANRSQQKLQVDLEQAFFHNQPPSLRRTVEFVAERVGSNCVKHMKATLVSELVQRGEELLRAGLLSPGASGPKLHEAIGAQLSDRGMEAPARATRFCSDKSPDAIRNLLPVETSPVVLTTSENITKRLATEKACSWLAANITALIRREWKSRFDRVMKSMDAQGAGLEPANQAQPSTPKRKPGGERALVCPTACPHAAPLPSDVLIQMKEVLSVGVGPRTEAELPTGPELRALLGRVGEALACRKFLTPVSEQMLLRSTVLLACQIVGGDLPVLSPQGVGDGEPGPSPGAGPGEGGGVLEALADLWERECCWATPLHLLFSELNVTAVLRAPPDGLDSYEFLVRRLLAKGLLGEEELASHWRKLSGVSPIQVFTEKFELLPFLLVKPAMALPETLSPTGQ